MRKNYWTSVLIMVFCVVFDMINNGKYMILTNGIVLFMVTRLYLFNHDEM